MPGPDHLLSAVDYCTTHIHRSSESRVGPVCARVVGRAGVAPCPVWIPCRWASQTSCARMVVGAAHLQCPPVGGGYRWDMRMGRATWDECQSDGCADSQAQGRAGALVHWRDSSSLVRDRLGTALLRAPQHSSAPLTNPLKAGTPSAARDRDS